VLIVARHGQTGLNADGRIQGRLDPPLNDLGVAQAAKIAERYGEIAAVLSSPLIRARQTAAAFGRPVEIDERWVEIDFGDYDGMRISDVAESTWNQWRTDSDYAFPNGESQRQVFERVAAACEALAARAERENVVVVSHVSAIKAAASWALGASADTPLRMRLDQASVCRIGFLRPGLPMLLAFNDTSHL
jgi:broad specificity phosphatase PhoE